MARYLTNERQYYCDECDVLITEREMIPAISSDTPGGFCPSCNTTQWMNITIFGSLAQENPSMFKVVG